MTHRKICCAVDFSQPSLLALAEAAELARVMGAKLAIVYVHPTLPRVATDMLVPPAELFDDEAKRVNAELARCRHSAEAGTPIAVNTITLIGDPAHELVRFANKENIDLLVVGTHGRTGVRRVVLGSVAEWVVRHAPCPVLVVRPTAQVESRELRSEVEQYMG